MKTRFAMVLTFSIGLSWMLLWFSSPRIGAQRSGIMPQRPSQVIEARARLVRPDDEASVRALADEIFKCPHVLGRMPATIEDNVKDRLVRSEMGILRGTRSGVREEDVVALFNTMADRFGLPDHVRTSKKQVRALRMSLALGSPMFMGRGLIDKKMNVGESVSPEMSVLQAAHLSAILLDQKFLTQIFRFLRTSGTENLMTGRSKT